MKDFANYHPIILFLYYLVVISLSMFFIHPLMIILSLFGSIVFFALLTRPKYFLRDIGFYFFVFLLIAITNPLFVHKGETILFFLNDNPVTLEAISYGIVIAMMLVSIVFWSKSYNEIMSSDKFIYLFGRVIPKLSLIISMALRFIPAFKDQFKKVNQTQKTLGLYTSDSLTDRVLGSVRTFNSLVSWSFENAIEKADAMKARGYGLKGRTNYSLFKWQLRDSIILSTIFVLFLIIMYFNGKKMFHFEFYPAITTMDFSFKQLVVFSFVFLLMILPALSEAKEKVRWNYLRSRI